MLSDLLSLFIPDSDEFSDNMFRTFLASICTFFGSCALLLILFAFQATDSVMAHDLKWISGISLLSSMASAILCLFVTFPLEFDVIGHEKPLVNEFH